MKKIFILLSLLIFARAFSYSSYKSDWWVISTGGADGSSGGGFTNETAVLGQGAAGISSEGTTYSSLYVGYVASFVKAEATDINFYDSLPSSSEINDGFPITCKVTIEAVAGNDIATSTVKVRISNSGQDPADFSDWFSGAIPDTEFSFKKIRYTIDIPTSSVGAVSFKQGNNYIQWRARDTGSNEQNSQPFLVKVEQADFTIVQPVDFSSKKPVFEIKFTGPIKPDSIRLTVDRYGGSNVISLTGSDNYDTGTGGYYKRWTGNGFTAGEKYTLTVQVEDISGDVQTKSSTFVVNDGAIADLIPFPSPFNPSIEGVSIRYVLDEDSIVSISIYDTGGELVNVLVDKEDRPAGLNKNDIWYAVNYANNKMANGIYFCEIVAEDSSGEHRRYIALAVLR